MLTMRKKNKERNSGMATIETLPILILFVVLSTYSLGFFGVIHSAILQSIAARAYAFETFRHRTEVKYFRHQEVTEMQMSHYADRGFRIHSIRAANAQESEFLPTTRRITFAGPDKPEEVKRSSANDKTFQDIRSLEAGKRNEEVGANPVWITISHGICIDANCGG